MTLVLRTSVYIYFLIALSRTIRLEEQVPASLWKTKPSLTTEVSARS